MQRIALVTGANRGIGFETVRGLAQRGYLALLGSRDRERGEMAAQSLREEGLTVDSIHLDVEDPISQADAAATIRERYGKLHVLVNNAAVILDRDVPPSAVTADVLRRTMETNFIMLVTLTQKMLPLLRAGRQDGEVGIVNLSSSRGSIAMNADPREPFGSAQTLAYSASKAAVDMFTAMLGQELRPEGIKVNSADPGWVKTEMGGAGALLEISEGAETSIRLATLEANGPTAGFFHKDRTVPW